MCSATQTDCENAWCKVSYEFGKKLVTSVNNNGPGSANWTGYDSNASCMPIAPNEGVKKCTGTAPDVHIINV